MATQHADAAAREPFQDSSEDAVSDPADAPAKPAAKAAEQEYPHEEEGMLGFLSWNRTSLRALRDVEHEILSHMKTPFRRHFVPVGKLDGKNEAQLWTISLNEESTATPLVMLHGFASGAALWCMNLEELAKDRPVHAIDVLGFGRSSRPNFAKDGEDVEKQFIDSIENFRAAMGFERMLLLGHSFGGYLVSVYAMAHPARVAKLLLADPWGFPEKTAADDERLKNLPLTRRLLISFVVCVNPLPLSALRCAGRMGPSLVTKVRGDIVNRYHDFLGGHPKPLIRDYIYHSNVQDPAGERAFKTLDSGLGWARRPLLERLSEHLPRDIRVAFVFGAQSWIKSAPGAEMKARRPDHVEHTVIDGNHHVYACYPRVFNATVQKLCDGH
eukprot:TRINITY_DN27636_c0_g1_i1.p1 TRINITY_DN27636_c0_g1~~TRINITY_DN27636_c0_g1_i1.p1  ORF type:complete len:385 (+),score=105.41 TRINITY_DN27636_c0_g1_i1:51-1205(+)